MEKYGLWNTPWNFGMQNMAKVSRGIPNSEHCKHRWLQFRQAKTPEQCFEQLLTEKMWPGLGSESQIEIDNLSKWFVFFRLQEVMRKKCRNELNVSVGYLRFISNQATTSPEQRWHVPLWTPCRLHVFYLLWVIWPKLKLHKLSLRYLPDPQESAITEGRYLGKSPGTSSPYLPLRWTSTTSGGGR